MFQAKLVAEGLFRLSPKSFWHQEIAGEIARQIIWNDKQHQCDQQSKQLSCSTSCGPENWKSIYYFLYNECCRLPWTAPLEMVAGKLWEERKYSDCFCVCPEKWQSWLLLPNTLSFVSWEDFFSINWNNKGKMNELCFVWEKKNAGLEQGTAVNRRCSNSELTDAKLKKEKEKKSCQ